MDDYIPLEKPSDITLDLDTKLSFEENIIKAIKLVNLNIKNIENLNPNSVILLDIKNLLDNYVLIKVKSKIGNKVIFDQFYKYRKINIIEYNSNQKITGTPDQPIYLNGVKLTNSQVLSEEEKKVIFKYLNLIESENFTFNRIWETDTIPYFYIDVIPEEKNKIYYGSVRLYFPTAPLISTNVDNSFIGCFVINGDKLKIKDLVANTFINSFGYGGEDINDLIDKSFVSGFKEKKFIFIGSDNGESSILEFNCPKYNSIDITGEPETVSFQLPKYPSINIGDEESVILEFTLPKD